MHTNGIQQNGMQRSLPALRLGQPPAFENPALTVSFDLLATGMSAYLGIGMISAKSEEGKFSGWALLWVAIAAAMGMKTLHDLSKIRTQVPA